MVASMFRGRAQVVAALAVVGFGAAAGPVQAATRPPSAAQIHRAIARVSRSSFLWATVNVCLPRPHTGGLIGIRGEMPALGFDATLSMTIELQQYLATRQAYVPVRGRTARHTVSLGTFRRGLHQQGAEFPYGTETGRLRGSVTFTWTRAGRRLARLTRTTTGGHPSAAFGIPPGHSSASCRL
jgi:hypothetical protein